MLDYCPRKAKMYQQRQKEYALPGANPRSLNRREEYNPSGSEDPHSYHDTTYHSSIMSTRFGKVGIGFFSKMYKKGGERVTNTLARVIGCHKNLTIQYAELVALEEALDQFTSSWYQIENQGIRRLNIYSDCKSALQALHDPRR